LDSPQLSCKHKFQVSVWRADLKGTGKYNARDTAIMGVKVQVSKRFNGTVCFIHVECSKVEGADCEICCEVDADGGASSGSFINRSKGQE
jgi:hypothetical protein